MIYVDPLSSGGIPPREIVEKIMKNFMGYPFCLYCPGDVHKITKPDIKRLIEEELPEFLGADVVRLHHGAREGAFLVLFSLYKHHILKKRDKAPAVILDGNTHYSMVLAVERSLLEPILTSVSDFPEYRVIEKDFEDKIEKVKERYGKPPLAIIVNYPDGRYGNFPNLKEIVSIAKRENVYVIVDGAYSIGRLPFSMKNYDVDVLIASAHKSMACIGPLGVIGMKEDIAKIVTEKSKYKPGKEVEFLGCSARGLPTLCLFYVMDYLKKRIKEWGKKVKIANYFIKKAEKELSFILQGEKPHKHDLLNFRTEIFYEISKRVRSRFFLYKELKERNVIGVKPGITKVIKISTYLLDKEKVDSLVGILKEIITKYKGNL